MRINKVQLAGLAVVLAGVAATGANAEDVTISSATTTPLTTSDPNPTAAPVEAGDITVASGGSITVAAGQTAITVNTSNDVSVAGALNSTDASNTTGIRLTPGNTGNVTNTGNISLIETYTLADADDDGDLDGAYATGTNRHGIFLDAGGTFAGDITSSGNITVEGNSSSALTLNSLLDGDLTLSGNISVTGDNSTAIAINEGVTGDVTVRSSLLARGENAQGLVVNDVIGGELNVRGTWTVSGFHSIARPADVSDLDADDLLLSGAAIAVHADVAGGITIEGIGVEDDTDDDDDGVTEAQSDADDDATAVIAVYGSAPALHIEADGANVNIGATSTGYGVHVQGSLSAAGVFDGVDANAMRIEGVGGSTVTIADGVAIDGTVQAAATNADSTAVYIGADASVSELLSRKTITSFVSSDLAQTAAAVVIDAGASVPEFTNTGSVRSTLLGETGDAVAIIDSSNTLATINNSGRIVAEIFATDSDLEDGVPPPPITGSAVAIDVSASNIDVTLNQTADVPFNDEDTTDDDATFRPPTVIQGDILLGSGNDDVNLLAGEILGDIAFGVGADAMVIDNEALFAGRMDDSDGLLTIDVQDGVLNHLGGTTNLTSANFSADSVLGVMLSDVPGESSFLHASGTVTFAAGAEVIPLVPAGLPVSGTHTFLTADGGLVGAANVIGAVDGVGAPFLYDLEIGVVGGDPNSLEASYLMKTTTELGLDANQTAAFDPIIVALRLNDDAAAAFAALSSEQSFFDAYATLMPSYASASTELAATAIQQAQSATTNRMAHTRLAGLDEVSVWVQEIGYGLSRDPGTLGGQEFRGNGFGLAAGIDGPLDNGALFGLSASFLASEAEEPARPEGEISSWFGQGNAYLGTAMGPVDLDFVVGAGFGQMRSRRFIQIGSAFEALSEAEWWAYEGHGAARASVPLALSDWMVITPQAALTYVYLNEQGYTEEGGGAAFDLDADSSTSQRLWGDVGVEFSARRNLRGGGYIAPRLYAGYRANMLDDEAERTFRFVSGGSSFTLQDEGLGDGGPLVGIGIDATNGYSTVSIGYEGEFGDQIERHSINAALRFRF
ncbi:MAG TPA: autotransporter outer membrane beta-barrel domain-containing protein [Vitreimonas sp.]|uniref:autotransporter family protein n=1 Tax=Vitreimonas sp. TaxID=3069702 RepID=UPI002D35C8AF|nr:autotransporter outer membrane beta-barrel domain-containing protein [Vitreimonas sp.]HYD88237.1 autotransporter outer membrane beta-barrel domain-containing protein [Vitreimonas sp.]